MTSEITDRADELRQAASECETRAQFRRKYPDWPMECINHAIGPPAEPLVRIPKIGRDKRILREVAQAHRVSLDDIIGPRRFKAYVAARREAMQRIRSELGFSYPHIGRLFNRDHTSVLHACRGGRPTNPPSEKGAAVTDIVETKLAQDLDAAVGAYQRKFGRQTLIERLKHMLARAEEAQRVTDESFERIGAVVRKAAE